MRTENNSGFVDAFNDYLELIAKGGKYIRTSDLRGIEMILSEFGNTEKYQVNFHWEDVGWMTFGGCELKEDVLELKWDKGWTHLIRPLFLEVYYFSQEPDVSFMRLGYSGLEPTGLYPIESLKGLRGEEYVRDGREVFPRECLESGVTGYDEAGDEILLSEEAEVETRAIIEGHFLIVSKGSILNDGRFDRFRQDLTKKGKESRYYGELLELRKKQG